MNYESYKKDLSEEHFGDENIQYVLDKYYHSETPYVFRDNPGAHGQFKRTLANEIESAFHIRCHPHHIVICGSASLGFSSAPTEKFGKPFSATESDVDVAILHPELFDRWWLELVNPKADLGKARKTIAGDLFNGFINPKVVHELTATGRIWWRLFREFDTGIFNKVRGRIYRDPQFMQNYHRVSVIKGREILRGARI